MKYKYGSIFALAACVAMTVVISGCQFMQPNPAWGAPPASASELPTITPRQQAVVDRALERKQQQLPALEEVAWFRIAWASIGDSIDHGVADQYIRFEMLDLKGNFSLTAYEVDGRRRPDGPMIVEPVGGNFIVAYEEGDTEHAKGLFRYLQLNGNLYLDLSLPSQGDGYRPLDFNPGPGVVRLRLERTQPPAWL